MSVNGDADVDDHFNPSVRLIEVERPDSSTCGFHLTRGKWDPYPWVSKLDTTSVAAQAGLLPGDCLLEVNGEDVVGKRISEVAQIVKRQANVSLLVWNAGANAHCSPDTLCCGPMPNNFQRLSACMSTILSSLECPICLDTSQPPIFQCENGHVICTRCRAKSEKCPVCRLRLENGRSLFADNVYHAIMDAFELRKVAPEGRIVKMNEIFRARDKNKKLLPDIKISPAHSNKLLARVRVGKASSVENLSSKGARSNFLTVDNEFNGTLKVKSLSSNEIFKTASSTDISRTNSTDEQFTCTRCSSLDSIILDCDSILYFCPFDINCTILFKEGDMYQHFESCHSGALIQYFKSKNTIRLTDNQSTYLIRVDNKYFALKIHQEMNHLISDYKDLRIWMWIFGTKRLATDYQLHINIYNSSPKSSILSTQTAMYSLNAVPFTDIKSSKKSIFLNAGTFSAMNANDVFIDVEIIKN